MPDSDRLLAPATKLAPKKEPLKKPAPASNPSVKPRAPVQTCDRDSGNDTCESIALEPSVFKIDFGRVPVGQQVLRTFAVTNPDPQTAVEVLQTEVTQPSGFGDFEAEGRSGFVQPKERFNITIAFRPTEAGHHAGKVRVLGNIATSPRIAVVGTGEETTTARDARVKSQDAESDKLRLAPDRKHFVERQRADIAIKVWDRSAADFARATAQWANQNWATFYKNTGGDFSVSWTEGHLNNVVGDALSNLAGLVTEHPLVSFAMSTVSSLLWDAAFTVKGNQESEELVHDKTKDVGQAINEKLRSSHSIEAKTVARTRAMSSTAYHRAWTATDIDQIETVRAWANQVPLKAPDPSNLSLATLLLKDWALERARGATGDSNTNSASYAEVRKGHFELDKGDDFKRRDLFVYQARHDWHRLSLSGIERNEHSLRDKIMRFELEGKRGGLIGERLTAFVAGKLNYEIWTDLDVPDRRSTAAALNAPDGKIGNRMTCRMTIAVDGESIVARHFYYSGNGATHAVRSP